MNGSTNRQTAMISNQETYINLSTRKRDGSFVDTPMWFAQEGETNKYYVYSLKNLGKVKRIRNYPEVKVGICTYSGKPKGGWFYAIADLVDEPENTKVAYSVLRKKYGVKFRIGDFFSWIKGTYHKRQVIRFTISQ